MSEVAMRHQGVWCCSKKRDCSWKGVMLTNGIGWGTVPSGDNLWTIAHGKHCRGKLIQLLEPADGSNNREGVDLNGTVINTIKPDH